MELSASIISHRGTSLTKTRSEMRLSECMIHICGEEILLPTSLAQLVKIELLLRKNYLTVKHLIIRNSLLQKVKIIQI